MSTRFSLDTDLSSTTMTTRQAPGSPVTAASNIRTKVKEMQKQLHNAQTGIEETNIELKRVRQMLDPLRLSMKRYTDQLETNIGKTVQNVVDSQGRENNRIDADVESLQDENRKLRSTIGTMQAQMDQMAASIQQLQGQVFGNYDSDEEAVQKVSKNGTQEIEHQS